ncbi:hypothetical protein GobsT_12660 [Gemmata obscuriglobus]|uniref:Uncharacterized protein n=1 Tax=Gemmata obscuriglobus TaxID=114 RepID=A0A2Z3HEU4_9BACT|nr:hypothetical protein [Gemmata obscuriglobus]AWM40274.1 hypothetical protein C1280_26905 [Gemmata obscuriglobus]QEG26526.1 hypothetical protein GobsT_12660 [Gemmata obscuriglobus]VTS01865.1 unnamed protein product [Gemmata obscuriglobus UQM 2246]
MIYASKEHQRGNTAGIASALLDLEKVSHEAEAAGDIELAEAIETQLMLVQRSPGLGLGSTTLHLRSGRRVPLDSARSHIQRSGGARPASTGKSQLTRDMERISAQCRALAGLADQQRIAAALANTSPRCARPAKEELCDFCGEEFYVDCLCG